MQTKYILDYGKFGELQLGVKYVKFEYWRKKEGKWTRRVVRKLTRNCSSFIVTCGEEDSMAGSIEFSSS